MNPELVVAGATVISSPSISTAGTWWLESRPEEAGRVVLVRRCPDGQVAEVTPRGFSVRSAVHEYGGGAYLVEGDLIIFSNWEDQRLYRQRPGEDPVALTPEQEIPRLVRYSDGCLTPDGQWLVTVRESHQAHGTPETVANELVMLPTGPLGDVVVLDVSHDFVAYPRLNPQGDRLAWITWDHPEMPWDSTSLWVAKLGMNGLFEDPRRVAGGDQESVLQPVWSDDGQLYYVSDRNGWWNPYRLGDEQPLVSRAAEFARPLWSLGQTTLSPLPEGGIACVWSTPGLDCLGVLSSGDALIEFDLPYSCIDGIASGWHSQGIVVVASSSASDRAVLLVDASTRSVETLRPPGDIGIDSSYVSSPHRIDFPSAGGRIAHGLFYPPRNPRFTGPRRELPPLLLSVHGGPTGAARWSLSLAIQYWTTRGFAVLDVDYGGSSGYGRSFRELLKGMWGVVDTEDCVAAADYLASEGKVDRKRMAIRGGSAGGFTALCALSSSEEFSAGAVYYGVTELEALARECHKFESHYTDGLVGPLPDSAAKYRARSPANRASEISSPVIFFHGLDDAVVPPRQAETMVRSLRDRGVPVAYFAYEGEQHGFRRAETIKASLKAEHAFYANVFGLGTADQLPLMELAL